MSGFCVLPHGVSALSPLTLCHIDISWQLLYNLDRGQAPNTIYRLQGFHIADEMQLALNHSGKNNGHMTMDYHELP